MIVLKEFTNSDFNTFISWCTSEEMITQFAGPIFTYPVTKNQLDNYLNDKSKKPFKVVLTKTQETIGHCELNFEEKETPKLSRVLIASEKHRGKNIGTQIISQLTTLAFKNKEITSLQLNVFSWNISAIKCYEKVGFKINPKRTSEILVNNEKWIKLNMILDRPL